MANGGDWGAVHHGMRNAVRAGVFPGAVLLVGRGSRIDFLESYGVADCRGGPRVTPETVFDLASLTKPLATAMAFLGLWQTGGVRFQDPVGRWLLEAAGTETGTISMEQLLAHTGGLPAHRPFYRYLRRLPPDRRKDSLRRWLLRIPLQGPPGSETRYSDLGYLLLEWVLERVAGRPLNRWLADHLYGPLALGLHFRPVPGRADANIAATERCGWRRRMVCGEVHDDNAWVCGGVAGHAGLFGAAVDVFRLLSRLLAVYEGAAGGPFGNPEGVRRLLTPVGPGRRTPGFDVPTWPRPSCGHCFSPETVGHLGFTGSSFWMDLRDRVIVVLLTHRVHPSRWNLRIRTFRPVLHDTIRATLGGGPMIPGKGTIFRLSPVGLSDSNVSL